MAEDRPQVLVQLLLGHVVVGRVREGDAPVRPQRDAVVGPWQVLGREPEVDRVAGDLVERPRRRELRLERLLAAVHRRRRLADHLDVAERVVDVAAAEVEVVEPERLLEHGRVLVLGQRQHGLAVVEHVVAADLPGPVRQPVGVPVGGRREQESGRVGRAARDDDEIAAERLRAAVVLRHHAGDRRARRVGLEPDGPRVGEQRDVRVLERRPHAEHLGVGLGVHEAGEAVARRAADAGAERRVRVVAHDAARRVEGAGSPRPPGRPRASGSAARARAPGTDTARSRGGSVGSSPRAPCTRYICSASV